MGMSKVIEAAAQTRMDYIWLAPTYKQVEIAWDESRKALAFSGAEMNESRKVIKLPTGGRAIFRSGDNPDSVRGYSAAGVVLDEASYLQPRLWREIVRPMLIDTDGWAWFIYTPKGFDWTYDEEEAARQREDSAVFYAPTLGAKVIRHEDGTHDLVREPHPLENPHIAWQEIYSAFKSSDVYTFEQEFLVKRGAQSGLVYQDFAGGNLTDDEADVEHSFELGFDDGYTDPRVILFIQRTGSKVLVFDEIYESKTLDETSVRHVLERCAKRSGKTLPSDSEMNGYAGTHALERAAAWCRENGVRLPDIAIGGTESVQLMKRFRLADIPARGGTHEIVQGIGLMRRLVCDGQNYRTLQVNRRCKNLLREMTRDYRYPDAGTRKDNEMPLDAENHAVDALRYWCFLRAR